MKMPDQVNGYSRLTSAREAQCNIAVCEERRMIRDSDNANCRLQLANGNTKERV